MISRLLLQLAYCFFQLMPQVRNALLSSCKLLLCLQPWACQLADAADTAVAFCLHYKLGKVTGDVKFGTLSESPYSGEVCACLTCVGKNTAVCATCMAGGLNRCKRAQASIVYLLELDGLVQSSWSLIATDRNQGAAVPAGGHTD